MLDVAKAMRVYIYPMAGIPLNQMTVMAIIMAFGLLVDDAIVVAEQIHRRNVASVFGSPVGIKTHQAAPADCRARGPGELRRPCPARAVA